MCGQASEKLRLPRVTRGWRRRRSIIIVVGNLRKRIKIVLLCFYLSVLLLFLFCVFACMMCMCACMHDVYVYMMCMYQRTVLWWRFSVSSFPSVRRIKLRSSSLCSNRLHPLSHLGGPEKKHMNRELPGMRRLALWRQGESTTERGKSDCESLRQNWGWHLLRTEGMFGKLCNVGGGQWQVMFEALKEVRSFKVLTP